MIQTFGFRGGCVTHTPTEALALDYYREVKGSVYVREIVAWWPDHTTTHLLREYPAGPWRVVKGVDPAE